MESVCHYYFLSGSVLGWGMRTVDRVYWRVIWAAPRWGGSDKAQKLMINRTWFFIAAIATVFVSGSQVYGFSMSGFNLSSKLRVASLGAIMGHDVEWFDEEDNNVGFMSANLAAIYESGGRWILQRQRQRQTDGSGRRVDFWLGDAAYDGAGPLWAHTRCADLCSDNGRRR